MFKLEIKKLDNSSYWIEYFNSLTEAQDWIFKEQSRPYWDNSYTYEIIDITPTPPTAEELAFSQKREKFLKRYNFSNIIKTEIAILNEGKAWDIAATQAYLADTTIKQINTLISDVSFASAKSVLETSDLSAYYSASEKQSIIDLIGDYLVNEG